MSWPSGRLSFPLGFLRFSAPVPSGSGVGVGSSPSGFGAHCGHLRLVLGRECWQGFVQVWLGDCRDGDLFGRLVDVVCGGEDRLVSLRGEVHVTDMGPGVYWDLETPDGQGGPGAAAAHQLGVLCADVINYLFPQLGRQTHHGPLKGFLIRVLLLGCV